MQYRKWKNTGETVSILGLGMMRLPTVKKDGKDCIDEQEATRLTRYAIDHGINYIDTAYMYHDHQSEPFVGRVLQDGYRQKVLLASKSPCGGFTSPDDFDRILNEQLEKLQTDHLDFYLLHGIGRDSWEKAVLPLGLLDKMQTAKASSKIRHIGFSFHDDFEAFRMIVDATDIWEFCQIQLNYADAAHQAGIAGLEYAAAKGLDVIIMEPLRGGKLAAPTQNVKEKLSAQKTPAEWGLDFLWDRSEVGTVLSGMSTMEQLQENLAFADRAHAGMLRQEEKEMLYAAGEVFNNGALVRCTHCDYCMPCPFGLAIPEIMQIYNSTATSWIGAAREAYQKLDVKADSCRSCKKCEKACPQQIEISAVMPKVAALLAEE